MQTTRKFLRTGAYMSNARPPEPPGSYVFVPGSYVGSRGWLQKTNTSWRKEEGKKEKRDGKRKREKERKKKREERRREREIESANQSTNSKKNPPTKQPGKQQTTGY
uniref:Uncharacterized protein n=1 Tax=Romanomermis culicivorax TaxID=13658 RepID=A0A915KTE9_ROMCU